MAVSRAFFLLMSNETLLVVDDSSEIRQFLKNNLLEPLGFQVLTAGSGEAALAIVPRENPHLILLDINMPGISGCDVLAILQMKHASIPVIMITSHDESSQILACFRLGAKDYLQKPFTAEEVISAIDKALAESRWMREREEMTNTLADVNYKLQRRIHAWDALNEVGRTIAATIDKDDAQKELMRGINKLMQVEAGSLFLVDESTGRLALQLSLYGDTAKQTGAYSHPGEGIAGWVFEHQHPLLIPDITKDRRFHATNTPKVTGLLPRSILAVPLHVHGKMIGVVEVINPNHGRTEFEQGDLEILKFLAASVAAALENAHLYEQMRLSVTMKTLRKTVVTFSHHINNSLTVILMVANFLNEKVQGFPSEFRPAWLNKAADSLIKESKKIAGVLAALNQITDVKEDQYLGEETLLDITEALNNI